MAEELAAVVWWGNDVVIMRMKSSWLTPLLSREIPSQLKASCKKTRKIFSFKPVAKTRPCKLLQTLFNPRNDDRLEEVFKFHVRYGSLAPIDLENYTEMFNGQLVNFKQIGAAV